MMIYATEAAEANTPDYSLPPAARHDYASRAAAGPSRRRRFRRRATPPPASRIAAAITQSPAGAAAIDADYWHTPHEPQYHAMPGQPPRRHTPLMAESCRHYARDSDAL